jgi:hypothetical protein
MDREAVSIAITSRAGWNARPPKSTPVTVARSARSEFIVHFSGASPDQSVRAIQDWCMDGRGFNDIDYNLLVRGTTGQAYMGRGWDIQGAHTVGHNTSGVAVCVISDGPISDAAKRSVLALYEQACGLFGRRLTKTMHRLLDQTECPGDTIARWVSAGMPAPEEEDMALTDDDLDKVEARVLAVLRNADGRAAIGYAAQGYDPGKDPATGKPKWPGVPDPWNSGETQAPGAALGNVLAAVYGGGTNRIAEIRDRLFGMDEKVTGLLATLVSLAQAEAAEVPPSAQAVADAVLAKLGGQTPEATAALLLPALGGDAAAVARAILALTEQPPGA